MMINMIKEKGLKYVVIFYKIPLLAALAIAFSGLNIVAKKIVYPMLGFGPRNPFYSLAVMALPLLLLGLWLAIAIMIVTIKTYTNKTGRSYFSDKGKYKRTYSELVEYFKDSEPHKLDSSSFAEKRWQDSRGIVFGKVGKKLIAIPSNCESNIAVYGPPGSSKTAGFAIINAITFNGSVLAVDVKGDIYNYLSKHSNRKIIRFCADAEDAIEVSARFDPLAELKTLNDTDKKLFLNSMATILIPDEGASENNYFSSRARKMYQGIVQLMLHKNQDTSFPDVVHAILEGNIFAWVEEAIASDCIAAKEQLASFYGNSEKNVTSAYDALTSALVMYSNPVLDRLLSNEGESLSIDLMDKGYDIYLQISQEHLDAYAPLFTLITESLSTQLKRRADMTTGVKNRPVLMLLDEFPQLTFSYKLIGSNLSTLRSKNVVIALIQQNKAQLEQRYDAVGARAILGNCNYQVILGSNDIESSKYYSDLFGDRKVLKVSNSDTYSENNSTGRTVNECTERVFPPEYFGDLKSDNKAVVYFNGKYCECEKLNCYID